MGCRWSRVQISPPRPRISQASVQEAFSFPAPARFQADYSVGTLRIARMKVLVSNDDGYFAPGITLLAEALRQLGEVTVVAPERDRSGASNSLTLDRPLSVRKAPNGFFFVNCTPTDCVHIAVTGLLDFTPDVVGSGVNFGANMGDDTIYSGTVAAATEGFLLGIPSIAFSLTSKNGAHFESAIGIALQIVERLKRSPVGDPML